jgi:hypothetical protein
MLNNVKTIPPRPTTRDLSNAIFRPHDGSFEEDVSTTREVVCYTISGREDQLDAQKFPILVDYESQGKLYTAEEDMYTFAKRVTIGKKDTYFARRSKQNKLYSPMDMFSDSSIAKNKSTKELIWPLVEVSKRVFDYYINFLKTKNRAYLANAERELV